MCVWRHVSTEVVKSLKVIKSATKNQIKTSTKAQRFDWEREKKSNSNHDNQSEKATTNYYYYFHPVEQTPLAKSLGQLFINRREKKRTEKHCQIYSGANICSENCSLLLFFVSSRLKLILKSTASPRRSTTTIIYLSFFFYFERKRKKTVHCPVCDLDDDHHPTTTRHLFRHPKHNFKVASNWLAAAVGWQRKGQT